MLKQPDKHEMTTQKDLLLKKIDQLTDEQAAELLRLLPEPTRAREVESPLAALQNDPTFGLPVHGRPDFRPFTPIEGSGEPLSRIILDSRR